nr:hypothetical protein Itr_chr03CG06020 [Ipomoea trifida]
MDPLNDCANISLHSLDNDSIGSCDEFYDCENRECGDEGMVDNDSEGAMQIGDVVSFGNNIEGNLSENEVVVGGASRSGISGDFERGGESGSGRLT